MPRPPSVASSVARAIERARRDGRLGDEHEIDVALAKLLARALSDGVADTARPPHARELATVCIRLGLITVATGPTELEQWLAGLDDDDDASPPTLAPGEEG